MDKSYYFYRAKFAERASRYEDLRIYSSQLARTDSEISLDERDLFYNSYRKLISSLRNAWNPVYVLEEKEKHKVETWRVLVLKEYREKLEAEMRDLCNEAIDIIDTYRLKNCCNIEERVFYLKMKGDCYRYLAEIENKTEQYATIDSNATKSFEAYETASELALNVLKPANPVRLVVALNLAVLFYDVFHSSGRAINLAKIAMEEGKAGLEDLNSTEKAESTIILKLLDENITHWSKFP